MAVFIAINWTYGRPANGAEEDEARASQAAWLILGNQALAAQDEYRRQWEALDDETHMTGLALLFVKAKNAAARALTQGWANPNGASCDIEVTAV